MKLYHQDEKTGDVFTFASKGKAAKHFEVTVTTINRWLLCKPDQYWVSEDGTKKWKPKLKKAKSGGGAAAAAAAAADHTCKCGKVFTSTSGLNGHAYYCKGKTNSELAADVSHLSHLSTHCCEDNAVPRLIAQTLGVDPKEVVALNKGLLKGLTTSSKLKAGTILYIPDLATQSTDSASSSASASASATVTTGPKESSNKTGKRKAASQPVLSDSEDDDNDGNASSTTVKQGTKVIKRKNSVMSATSMSSTGSDGAGPAPLSTATGTKDWKDVRNSNARKSDASAMQWFLKDPPKTPAKAKTPVRKSGGKQSGASTEAAAAAAAAASAPKQPQSVRGVDSKSGDMGAVKAMSVEEAHAPRTSRARPPSQQLMDAIRSAPEAKKQKTGKSTSKKASLSAPLAPIDEGRRTGRSVRSEPQVKTVGTLTVTNASGNTNKKETNRETNTKPKKTAAPKMKSAVAPMKVVQRTRSTRANQRNTVATPTIASSSKTRAKAKGTGSSGAAKKTPLNVVQRKHTPRKVGSKKTGPPANVIRASSQEQAPASASSSKRGKSQIFQKGKTSASASSKKGKTPVSASSKKGKIPISASSKKSKTPASASSKKGKTPASASSKKSKTPASASAKRGNKTPTSTKSTGGTNKGGASRSATAKKKTPLTLNRPSASKSKKQTPVFAKLKGAKPTNSKSPKNQATKKSNRRSIGEAVMHGAGRAGRAVRKAAVSAADGIRTALWVK
jgi:hypothetical protein